MPLLPRVLRRFSGGGQLGYESQLGNTLGGGGGSTVDKAGDALYQNLPPLITPYIHVKPADLDGIRAAAAAQTMEKNDALREDLGKMRDQALKDSKMTGSGKARVAKGIDGFLTNLEEQFRANPALLASGATRTGIIQNFNRAVDHAFITSNSNGMASSERTKTDIGADRMAYAAYDNNGRRMNRTNASVLQDYQENVNASTDPLNLVARNGNEKDSYAAIDKLMTMPTSTFGSERANVGVGEISGSQGERYVQASSNSSVTTTNRPVANALGAAMLGYTDKKGVRHAGNWKGVLSESEVYGLEEPVLTKYDNAPLVRNPDPKYSERITVNVPDARGQMQTLTVTADDVSGPFAGRNRREILQYLETNPTAANKTALNQLEHNRAQLADRDIKSLLATRLGLKVVNGTVSKQSKSAARIAPTKNPAAAKDGGTTLFGAAGGQSPIYPTAALTTYSVIGQDGTLQTVTKTDAQGKTSQVPIALNPAVSLLSGVEGVGDWMDRAIKQTGYTSDVFGAQTPMLRPKSMEQFSNQEAIYHLIPGVGIRQVQGGGLGKMPQASNIRIISHDATLTWMDASPMNGIVGREQVIQRITEANSNLEKQRNANQIDQATFDQRMNRLKIEGQAQGVLPYMRVIAATSENVLKDINKPTSSKNEDGFISRFGYLDPKTKKAVRPDQFIFGVHNDIDGLLKLGWTYMTNSEAKNAGIGDLNETANNGVFGSVFKTTMYVPATNITFNSSAKVANQNATNVEAEKRQQGQEEAVSSGQGGQWNP